MEKSDIPVGFFLTPVNMILPSSAEDSNYGEREREREAERQREIPHMAFFSFGRRDSHPLSNSNDPSNFLCIRPWITPFHHKIVVYVWSRRNPDLKNTFYGYTRL